MTLPVHVVAILSDFTDPALWYMGGSVAQARYMSRFVALQVHADLVGTPLEIYRATPSSGN